MKEKMWRDNEGIPDGSNSFLTSVDRKTIFL